jgi:mutator protein MutT
MKKNNLVKGRDYIGVGGGCLIFNEAGEVLLIRRAGEVRNEAGWWSKPGGGVKFGEKVEEAMIREMKEELGIGVKLIGYLPHTNHFTKNKKQHWVAFNFIAKIISGEPKNMESNKCDGVAWFPLNKLPDKITQTTVEPIKNYLAKKWIEI